MENNQITPPLTDQPMDEFEVRTVASQIKNFNSKRIVMILGAVVAIIILIMSVLYVVKKQPTQQVVVSPKPGATATPKPTEISNFQYPQEYKELDVTISTYEKSTSNVPETRTRLDVPQIDPTVSF
jgi:hypothetical protein